MNKNQPYYIRQSLSSYSAGASQKRINTMIYYLFPRANIQINQQLYCICISNLIINNNYQIISNSLYKYIEEIKDTIHNTPYWNAICKNPYLYINTISTIKHVSFIFYELIEIYHLMRLNWIKNSAINTIHFGKFANSTMKMCQYIRKNYQTVDQYDCVYPPNYSIASLDYYYREKKNSIDILFCDASGDNEYQNAIELLKQLCIGFCAQKYKGMSIIKYGDSFSILSLDVITFLSHFYDKTYFIKPSVCDLASSDKYIVCKCFMYNGLTDRMYQNIRALYLNITRNNLNMKVERIFNHTIPIYFSSRLEEINSIFGQSRLEYIQYFLTHIDKLNADQKTIENNIKLCTEWCIKYNIPFLM